MRTFPAGLGRIALVLAVLLVPLPIGVGALASADTDPAFPGLIAAASPVPQPLAAIEPEGGRISQPDTAAPADCEPITWTDYNWLPFDPLTGEVVTFTVSSLLPTTATLPIAYGWDFEDGTTGSGDPITHTFVISGSYWVYLAASNDCSEVYMSHPIDVFADPTTESDIELSPENGFTFRLLADVVVSDTLVIGNAPGATAYLAWDLAEEPAASWLTTAPISGVLAPGSSDSVVVAVDTTGLIPGTSYSTTLRITSNDPDESPWTLTTADLEVVHRPVETVTLGISNTGQIYTDTVVSFSANLEPDNATKPYTYSISYGSGSSAPAVSSVDPHAFEHTFGATGTYTVTFIAWNCDWCGLVDGKAYVTVVERKQVVYLPMTSRGQ